MFRVKVPFFWFSIPENLHVEARPNCIQFYEEFSKELTQERYQRIFGTILLSGLAMFFFAEWQSGMANSTTSSIFGHLRLIPMGLFLGLAIMINLRRRVKHIVFDFNENKVKLKPVTLSFIGSKSAKMASPFKLKIKKKTREIKRSDDYGASWTKYHEGYEIMVRLEKRGYDSIMFLETDDIKRDYGELIGKLAAVAGIDDPLLEIEENES